MKKKILICFVILYAKQFSLFYLPIHHQTNLTRNVWHWCLSKFFCFSLQATLDWIGIAVAKAFIFFFSLPRSGTSYYDNQHARREVNVCVWICVCVSKRRRRGILKRFLLLRLEYSLYIHWHYGWELYAMKKKRPRSSECL